jgi:DNA-binding MarR family transcriptional regulator
MPLSALLSQTLVAFTIELDNEFEHRMHHRTTNHGSTGRGPWLTSFAMWANFLRFVGEDGIGVGELRTRPGVEPWALPGMIRWSYVMTEGGAGVWRGRQPPPDATVRLRSSGRRAAAIWSRLPDPLERRWRKRFGEQCVGGLRDALAAIVGQVDRGLPHYLTDGRYELRVKLEDGGAPPTADMPAAGRDLIALLSQALLLYAAGYDSQANWGLALGANQLRVLSDRPTRLRDLAPRVGLARETSDVITGRMASWGLVTIEPDPRASRGKVARLTDEGLRAQARYLPTAAAIEQGFGERFGRPECKRLRAALAAIVQPGAGRSPLWEGLEPHPDCWRASLPRPEVLPHYPVVTHRGGYPDGS